MRKENISGCVFLYVINIIVIPFLLLSKSSRKLIYQETAHGHAVSNLFFSVKFQFQIKKFNFSVYSILELQVLSIGLQYNKTLFKTK
jgi:hypothetical protein